MVGAHSTPAHYPRGLSQCSQSRSGGTADTVPIPATLPPVTASFAWAPQDAEHTEGTSVALCGPLLEQHTPLVCRVHTAADSGMHVLRLASLMPSPVLGFALSLQKPSSGSCPCPGPTP